MQRLVVLLERLTDEPDANPVLQLSLEISRELEAGAVSPQNLQGLIKRLSDRAFASRAERLAGYVGPTDPAENEQRLQSLIRQSAEARDFEEFSRYWSNGALGCVFTGHPTFLLSEALRSHLVTLATAEGEAAKSAAMKGLAKLAHRPDDEITLDTEHLAALAACRYAQDAIASFNAALIDEARRRYPDRWRAFDPTAVTLGTWVGYDMDGRTDIGWSDAIRFRLVEKLAQLRRYKGAIEGLITELAVSEPDAVGHLSPLLPRLDAACRHTQSVVDAFSGDICSPEALSAAANLLTGDDPGRMTSAGDLIDGLNDAVHACADDQAAARIMVWRAEMKLFTLGAAEVHFRINATQLDNAIRRRSSLDDDIALSSRTGLARVISLIENVEPVAVNFASLSLETTTAIRQFLAMAQILKHIDGDCRIRLLIAETERPVTVLAAIYFAHLFGIADRIDVSPLFETEPALENAARFLDVLLSIGTYRKAVRRRGRLCVQTGFSDAGRFFGQIPAALAIERLQGRLAELAQRHGLNDVSFLVFDTHGESMGRGAHPTSMQDRIHYVLSPWARWQFQKAGLPLLHEISFQGGDGFVFFGSPAMAFASLTRTVEATYGANVESSADDPLYEDIDLSLDFFRNVKRYQEEVLEDPSYHRSVSALGLSLLNDTGSRKTRRQSEIGGEQGPSLRRIRAIPHNAALQQLGYLVNVVAGVGTVTRQEPERFADLVQNSDRAQRLFRLLIRANQLSSLKTVAAYGSLFDGALWAARPYYGREQELTEPCLYLARLLTGDERYFAALKFATKLRIDALMLRQLLAMLGHSRTATEPPERLNLQLLHAIRLALIQHIFILAARIPRFSTRNDISRGDIMELIFELQIPEALVLLRDAYPLRASGASQFTLHEEAAYPGGEAPSYADLNQTLIDPIEESFQLIHDLGVGIAHEFSAHG